RQAPTQAAGFLADLDCTIMDVSCRDSELSEIPCGEPRKTVFSRSNRDLFPFVVRYRTMNGAGNLQTALRYLRAMVRYLTMRGDSVFTIIRRFFEVPYSGRLEIRQGSQCSALIIVIPRGRLEVLQLRFIGLDKRVVQHVDDGLPGADLAVVDAPADGH